MLQQAYLGQATANSTLVGIYFTHVWVYVPAWINHLTQISNEHIQIFFEDCMSTCISAQLRRSEGLLPDCWRLGVKETGSRQVKLSAFAASMATCFQIIKSILGVITDSTNYAQWQRFLQVSIVHEQPVTALLIHCTDSPVRLWFVCKACLAHSHSSCSSWTNSCIVSMCGHPHVDLFIISYLLRINLV